MQKFQITMEIYREYAGLVHTETKRCIFSERSEHRARRRMVEDCNFQGWFVRHINVVRV